MDTTTLIFALLIVIGIITLGELIILISLWRKLQQARQRANKLEAQLHNTPSETASNSNTRAAPDTAHTGLDGLNQRQQQRVDSRKQTILETLEQQTTLSSGHVADMFDVTGRTARRYLSELVEEGRIVQSRESGPATTYHLPRNNSDTL